MKVNYTRTHTHMYTWNIHILIKLKLEDDECKRRCKSLQEKVCIDVGMKTSKTMNYKWSVELCINLGTAISPCTLIYGKVNM